LFFSAFGFFFSVASHLAFCHVVLPFVAADT